MAPVAFAMDQLEETSSWNSSAIAEKQGAYVSSVQ